MKLKWRKAGNDWFAIKGKFRAEVKGPHSPLGFCNWSVWCGKLQGGSGGTSSVQASKQAAEHELNRFARFLAVSSVLQEPESLKSNAKPLVLPTGMTWTPITFSAERWYFDHERMYLGQQP